MILSQIPIQLNKSQIAKELHLDHFPHSKQSIIEQYLLQGLSFIEAKGIIERMPANKLDFDALGLMESVKEMNEVVTANLLLATIGNQLEKELEKEIQNGNILKSMVFHALGVWAVHQAMDYLQQLIKKGAQQQGYQYSKRNAPGYNRWQLEKQSELLSLLAGERVEVSITSDFILTPIYTLTGIVFKYKEDDLGLFKNRINNSCLTCNLAQDKKECDYKIYCQKA